MIKSLTVRHIFTECPEVKKQLWGGEFWSDEFFASTVGKHGDEAKIANYVKNQGSDAKYDRLYNLNQLAIFELITRYLAACGGVIHRNSFYHKRIRLLKCSAFSPSLNKCSSGKLVMN